MGSNLEARVGRAEDRNPQETAIFKQNVSMQCEVAVFL